MQWVQAVAGWIRRRPAVTDGETIVHELSEALQKAGHAEAVKSALIDSVRRLTGAPTIRFDPGPSPSGSTMGVEKELQLYACRNFRGRLLIESHVPRAGEWTPETRRRLDTICTMAAYALGRCAGADGADAAQDPGVADHGSVRDSRSGSTSGRGGSTWRTRDLAKPIMHDTSFLSAVLPYALGQAQRHGEPLALLCVAIDRLHGIQELMGEDVVERAMQNVGTHLALQLRSSDIVARMDDERIIILLPRARIQGAHFVAQKLCRSVETASSLLPELPCLTLSIGVAEFPGSAQSVEGLLEAGGTALRLATEQGRNRAVVAPLVEQSAPSSSRRPSMAC